MTKRIIAINIVNFLSSNFFSQIARVIRGFIVARFLGPELMGIWATLYIFLMYGENFHFGIYNALTRNIPILRGQKDQRTIQRYINNAFSYTLVCSCLVLLSMSIVNVVGRPDSFYFRQGLKFVAFLLITQQWVVLYKFLLISDNNFRILSRVQFFYSILSLMSALLVIPFSFLGQMWGLVFTDLIYIGILVHKNMFKFSFEFNKFLLLKMFKTGFPIYLVGLMFVVLLSVNRLIIFRTLGATELGYFSIAFLVFSFLYFFPESIRSVIYVKMGEDYGLFHEAKESLKKHLLITSKLLSVIMPFVLLLSVLAVNIGIPFLLPQYVPGIQPALIYILAVLFLALSAIFGNFLNIIRRQSGFLLAQIVAILLNIVVAIQMVKNGFGLSGVAFASLVAYFFYFILMAYISLSILHIKPVDIVKTIVDLLFPSFGLIFIFCGFNYLLNSSSFPCFLNDLNLPFASAFAASIATYLGLVYVIIYNDSNMKKVFNFEQRDFPLGAFWKNFASILKNIKK